MRTAISLFSGAGGIDFGLEAAGFTTRVALEMDHDCCRTLRANRRWPVLERDILSVPTSEILEAARLEAGDVDLVVGGPPCQPFSKSGYWASGDSLRLNDPRSATLLAFLRVVEEAKPKVFMLENVEGLAFSGKDEGLRILLERVREINRLTDSSYQPVVQVMNAAEHGVPQVRERVIIVAARNGKVFRFPNPTFRAPEDQAHPSLPTFRTAWDALGHLDLDAEEDLGVRGKWGDLLPSIPEGQNYLHHTDRGGGLPLFGWRRRYWGFLLKLAKSRPSWTIQAQPGPAIGPFHWDNRRLSIKELCALQTFPAGLQIVGSRTSQQKQLGNAVPSLLAEILGRAIITQLLGGRVSRSPKLAVQARTPTPPPRRPGRVPDRFRALVGDHSAHPGTGKGYAALARQQALVWR